MSATLYGKDNLQITILIINPLGSQKIPGIREDFALQNDENYPVNQAKMTEIMKNKKFFAGILAKQSRVRYDEGTTNQEARDAGHPPQPIKRICGGT